MPHQSQRPFFSLFSVCTVVISALMFLSFFAPHPAHAADHVSRPHPGIKYTHRSLSNPRKEIHIVEIDLRQAGISIRTTKSSERGRTPSSFSDLVDAAVVVNGDFFNTDGSYDPNGLAIGNGSKWDDGNDNNSAHFIACTAQNDCTIETANRTTAADPSWRSAVGGRRVLLKPGFQFSSDNDADCGAHCTTLHPRTAVGLKAGGDTMILVLVEGRQDPIFGMKISQLAKLMKDLGAEVALELDGGGSSTMIIDGDRVSGRPDNEPSQRRVANHLAILFNAAAANNRGKLVGFVRRDNIQNENAGIGSANIRLSTGATTTTRADGYYEFASVPVGSVTVTASKNGFNPVSADKDVEGGITNWRSIAMTAAPAPQPVDAGPAPVDAGPPPVDAGPPDAGTPDAGVVDPNDAVQDFVDAGGILVIDGTIDIVDGGPDSGITDDNTLDVDGGDENGDGIEGNSGETPDGTVILPLSVEEGCSNSSADFSILSLFSLLALCYGRNKRRFSLSFRR